MAARKIQGVAVEDAGVHLSAATDICWDSPGSHGKLVLAVNKNHTGTIHAADGLVEPTSHEPVFFE